MPVLTASEYETLRPHFPVIRKYREVGQEVSTAPRPVMATIYQRIHGTPANMCCAGAISQLYDLFNLYLDDYEQNP